MMVDLVGLGMRGGVGARVELFAFMGHDRLHVTAVVAEAAIAGDGLLHGLAHLLVGGREAALFLESDTTLVLGTTGGDECLSVRGEGFKRGVVSAHVMLSKIINYNLLMIKFYLYG